MRYINEISILLFTVMLSCCGKPNDPAYLKLSQTSVSQGEPLTAQVFNIKSGARLVWQFPAYARVLKYYSPDSSLINLVFSDMGSSTKEICVRVYEGADTANYYTLCKEINIDSARFAPNATLPNDRVASLSGDQLILHPEIYPTDSTLNFIIETRNNYDCLNAYVLHNNSSIRNNIVSLSFNGVWLPLNCEPAKMPAISFCDTHSYYKDGTYPVELVFNGKKYQGSLTVSKFQGQYEFDWPYTEGVIIEPKVLGK